MHVGYSARAPRRPGPEWGCASRWRFPSEGGCPGLECQWWSGCRPRPLLAMPSRCRTAQLPLSWTSPSSRRRIQTCCLWVIHTLSAGDDNLPEQLNLMAYWPIYGFSIWHNSPKCRVVIVSTFIVYFVECRASILNSALKWYRTWINMRSTLLWTCFWRSQERMCTWSGLPSTMH